MTGSTVSSALRRDNHFWGQGGGDYFHGGGGNDILDGGRDGDIIYGEAGNDTVIGGSGQDYLDGGSGIDTVVYTGSPAGVTVDLADGSARGGDGDGPVQIVGRGTAIRHDILVGFENAVGSFFGDHLIGNAGDNRLFGRGGDDTLTGGGGGRHAERRRRQRHGGLCRRGKRRHARPDRRPVRR